MIKDDLSCLALGTAVALFAVLYMLCISRKKDRLYRLAGRMADGKRLFTVAGVVLLILWVVAVLHYVDGVSRIADMAGKTVAFAAVGMVCAIFVYSVRMWVKSVSAKTHRHVLLWSALAVWSVGYVLFFIGYYEHGTEFSPAALLIRPAISSAELFVSSIDLLEVSHDCKADSVYMSVFAITSLSALAVSASVIIYLAGIRIKSLIQLRTMRSDPGEHLYLFWGINTASLVMAKQIQAHKEEEGGQSPDMIFIDNRDESEEGAGERMSFERIMNMFFIRRKSYGVINGAGVQASLCVSDLDIMDWRSGTLEEFLQRAALKDVLRMVRDAEKVHFFFLSEDGGKNVMRTMSLRDCILRDTGTGIGEKCVLYCHACVEKMDYSRLFRPGDNPSVKVVDTALLAVNQLKYDPDLLPVNFVRPDAELGVATKPFNALIAGFGETGQEAFRYLYEFGAFVAQDGKSKNRFKCYVADPGAERLREDFLLRVPALKGSDELEFIGSDEDAGFWDRIREIVRELDYVVVTVGNDDNGISFAVKMYELALKYRDDSEFCVAVRTYDAANHERAVKIAEYYRVASDRPAWRFRVFGEISRLFTYENVIEDRILDNAMKFFYEYQKSSGEKVADTAVEEWNRRRDSLFRGGAGMSLLASHNKLRQQEMQDISNALHIGTKMRLAGISGSSDPRLGRMLEAVGGRDLKTAKYVNATTPQKRLLMNLAKCEHLRWNASNIMLGYTELPMKDGEPQKNRKDYVKRQLSCLVPNTRLLEVPSLRDTVRYDCCTVDVSFRIVKNVL